MTTRHRKQFGIIVMLLLLSIAISGVSAQDDLPDIHPGLLSLAGESAGALETDSSFSAFSTLRQPPQVTLSGAETRTATIGTASELSQIVQIIGDSVRINAIPTGDPQSLLAELNALGFQGASNETYVAGLLPIRSIGSLYALDNLESAVPSVAETRTGSIAGEAIQALAVDNAFASTGVTGDGITVGVISDSFDCAAGAPTNYADDVASGDLPAGIVVLADITSSCIDEGRAMAQLIYDVAPGVEMMFHTAFISEIDFADGVVELADAGADVIVDDIGYFTAPFFQDGVVAQAADEVNSRGIPYFSSAGNAADQGYQANFNPSGITVAVPGLGNYELHDFDPGPGLDPGNETTVAPGIFNASVWLQWNDPYASLGGAGADAELEFLLFSQDFSVFFGAFTGFNSIGQDPWEAFGVSGPFNFQIAVGARTDTNYSDTFFRIYHSSSGITKEYEGDPTLWGHTNAEGTIAVGASFFGSTPAFGTNPPLLNSFSSYGPTPIFFDTAGNPLASPIIRQRPQITTSDGSNNTFFGNDTIRDADSLPNFFGTSAAAPHAAAVAALMLEANPGLTPNQIEQTLINSAIDIVATNDVGGPASNQNVALASGYDYGSGYGLIQANIAVQSSAGVGITVAPQEVTFNATESGYYSIVLNSNPIDEVTVHGYGDGPCEVFPGSLTFTPQNWDEPQEMTIGSNLPGECTISHQVEAAGIYSDATAADVEVVVLPDPDIAAADDADAADPDGLTGTDDLLSQVTQLPATGEAPFWRDWLWLIIGGLGVVGAGSGAVMLRQSKRQS